MILLRKYIQEKKRYFLKYAVMNPQAMFHFARWDTAVTELGSFIWVFLLWWYNLLKIKLSFFKCAQP